MREWHSFIPNCVCLTFSRIMMLMRSLFGLMLLIITCSYVLSKTLTTSSRNALAASSPFVFALNQLSTLPLRKTNAIDKNVDAPPMTTTTTTTASPKRTSQLIASLRAEIREKEDELQTAERINKGFERMIELMHLMGHVDTFLADRARFVLRKLALVADDLNFSKNDNNTHEAN